MVIDKVNHGGDLLHGNTCSLIILGMLRPQEIF